ncbi:DUF3667 domain-containing protein [Hyunsoonleella pacifica]|uniref:DUF3667 domain-containing protein n=1 Tax=Hyunsoonleella pacifica TaxID=1080224 RepID=A0A4Q9FIS1_9FLAO|nr:DUF3667 domain-containing protein [Hyunsoonleella pacifica]TBN13153.1 DUF3667 domain-containing protein [Hyunsoonleella pacifica]GGD28633.1 hypothetical protein GCM10011368_33260 [Hyunsoonleella pacifica]
MNCKNCNSTLRTDYSYCPDCGGKVVRQRITNKSLVYDFLERYFNLDNTFLKTISHMITKPEEVCGGYISGLRKKYLNPVSMLAISLTSSGFILFLMKKIAWENIDFSKVSYAQTSSGGAGTEKIMASTMEYSSLLFLFYIPVLAFASYVFFNKKNYNLAEHIVTAIYALTTFSIISSIYAIIMLLANPQFYIDTALIYSVVMVLFCVYVAYKNSQDKKTSLFWRVPLFLLFFLVGYFGISILTIGGLLLTGEISFQDFIPKT